MRHKCTVVPATHQELQETQTAGRSLLLEGRGMQAYLSVGEGLGVLCPVLAPPCKFCTCSSTDCLLQMWLLTRISVWLGGRGMMLVKCTNCTVLCTSSLGLGVRIMGAEFQPSARKEETLCLAPAWAALSVVTGVLEVGTCPERHPLALDCAGPWGRGCSSSRATRDTAPLSPQSSCICTAAGLHKPAFPFRCFCVCCFNVLRGSCQTCEPGLSKFPSNILILGLSRALVKKLHGLCVVSPVLFFPYTMLFLVCGFSELRLVRNVYVEL